MLPCPIRQKNAADLGKIVISFRNSQKSTAIKTANKVPFFAIINF